MVVKQKSFTLYFISDFWEQFFLSSTSGFFVITVGSICTSVHQFDKKRSWEMMCKEKPDIVKDREAEKALQRVATRYSHMFSS